jgi:hypothetical protein
LYECSMSDWPDCGGVSGVSGVSGMGDVGSNGTDRCEAGRVLRTEGFENGGEKDG